MTNQREDLLVWIDLETTGLDCDNHMMGVQKHKILEVGMHITDSNYNIIDEGLSLIIHHDKTALNGLMNDYVLNMHTENGLLDKVETSTVSLYEAQDLMIKYLKDFNISPQSSPICGNNVGFDKNFLDAQMPNFSGLLHYRKIDVSTLKEIARRQYPEVFKLIQKSANHRALDDIKESIQELQIYQNYLFLPSQVKKIHKKLN